MIYDAEKNAVLITVDELCSAAYGFSDLGAGGGYAVCERVTAGDIDYIISGGVELEAPNGNGLYTLSPRETKGCKICGLGFSAHSPAVSLGLTKYGYPSPTAKSTARAWRIFQTLTECLL